MVVLGTFSPALGLSSVYPASVGTWGIWRRCSLVCCFILRSYALLIDFTITLNELRQRWWVQEIVVKSCDSPCTNVTWCNHSLSWSSEQTCQIVSLVSSGLHIIAELYHYNVGHGVTILHKCRKHITVTLLVCINYLYYWYFFYAFRSHSDIWMLSENYWWLEKMQLYLML